MFYELPKIWKGRIKKFWDETLPANIPASGSKFALIFDTEDEKTAVKEFKEELGTEDSVVVDFIPEGSFLSGATNVYDVKGERDKKTLLCPEKITTDDPFVVLHYDEGEWVEVEDPELIDGYIWGVIPSEHPQSGTVETPAGPEEEDGFSPIAVIFHRKDIELVESCDFTNFKFVVGNGNPIQLSTVAVNDADHIIAKNLASGTTIDLTEKNISYIFGGAKDTTSFDSTFITADGINNNQLRIYPGSVCYNDDYKSSCINNATVKVTNSTVRGITACYGMNRIENYNVEVDNSTVMFIAAGQTTIDKLSKDANKSLEDISLASAEWVKNAKYNITNSTITWLYTGGNSGYSYTVNAESNVKNTTVSGGIVGGGSNGMSDNVKYVLEDVTTPSYSSVNRGVTHNVTTKVKNCTITELGILTASDDDITGLVDLVSIDIDNATCGLVVGKNGGEVVDNADNVNYVKISRDANYTISKNDLNLLGDKFITK